MATLIELTSQIVSAHISNKQMTSDEMLQELQKVHASLKALEAGTPVAFGRAMPAEAPKLSFKQAFKKDEVICMICGQGFKTLKRHLGHAHNLKPGQYRKQFNIPASQALVAKSYSESRRKAAEERGLGEVLVKARETRAAKLKDRKVPVQAVKGKASVQGGKAKATVPKST